MASEYGILAYVQPPILEGVTQPDLIKFETQYAKYKDHVKKINDARPANDQIRVASTKDCMEGTLLHALCMMGKIQSATVLEDATDANVQLWFDATIAKEPKDMSERIRAALKCVYHRPNNHKEDPAGGVTTFCVDAMRSLDRHNASDALKQADKAKYFFDKLEDKVEPPLLRERLRMKRSTWTKQEQGSMEIFESCLTELAVDVDQMEVARARLSKKREGSAEERNGSSKKAKRKAGPSSHHGGRNESEGKPGGSENSGNKKKGDGKWDKPCLNPECSEKHRLKDCKITDAIKKKELYNKYFESNKKNLKVLSKKADGLIEENTPNPGDGRYRVTLEGEVNAVALGDYGADVSVISEDVFKEICAKGEPEWEHLNEPVVFELACSSKAETEDRFKANKKTTLSILIHLPGSNLPVRLRGVEFHVCDSPMKEVLLGRPFLKAIGFDLQAHLESVGSEVHGKDLAAMHVAEDEYDGLRHGCDDGDPIEYSGDLDTLIGGIAVEDPSVIQNHLENMVSQAAANGLKDVKRLRQMLQSYRDIFRTRLGPDKPARVPPFKIAVQDGAQPFRTPQRRYGPKQAAFINTTISHLEKVGAVVRNPTAKWASPALAVPKPGSDTLRFTVDLRGVNSRTVSVQSAMPHLESSLQELSGAKCFAKLDLSQGYWQLALDESSQELMSIQTPQGVYTPTRLLQGGTDSGNYFQAILWPLFAENVRKFLQWVDDFLLHAANEEELLTNLGEFFRVCEELNLKLHAAKCILFSRAVTFCGRQISETGTRHNPRNLEALVNMSRPSTGAALQQFLCAANWCRTSIPDYSKRTAPLHDLLEEVYRTAGFRSKARIRKIPLVAWGATHDAAFADIKSQLGNSAELAHVGSENDYALCLFTDASETHWGSVLTQIPISDLKIRPIENQSHQPIAFLSGKFSGPSERWSTPEKEGYAVVQSMCQLDHITSCRQVNVFTDHRNLVYLYDPVGRNPGVPRHTANKLLRWALKLSSFQYVIEHLSGEENVWADLLSRWANGPAAVVDSRVVNLSTLLLAPVSPAEDDEFDMPAIGELKRVQGKSKVPRQMRADTEGDLFKDSAGRIWIPDDADVMKLRLMIAGHCAGFGVGHRGAETTLTKVKEFFVWNNMANDVRSFIGSCLHCLASEGTMVPRPLGQAMHSTKPNGLIHFDYLYVSSSGDKFVYILVLKDDLSGYTWLVPTKTADAENTARELARWFAAFGVVSSWVSDQGSHFKNAVVAELKEHLRATHHFTLAYSPWSNGTVEQMNRQILKAIRAISSELKLSFKCWPEIVPLVQALINNSPVKRLGNRTPKRVFTGLEDENPLRTIITRGDEKLEVRSIEDVRLRQKVATDDLQRAVEMMHREVATVSTDTRRKHIEAHNRRTNVRPANFAVGDFVLKGVMSKDRVKKPSLRWRGPYRVTQCRSEYIFEIEEILTKKREEAHGRRLKFFRNSSYEVDDDLLEHLRYQSGELLLVERIDDVRRMDGVIEMLVKWRGFSEDESDWVTLTTLQEDVPALVKDALADFSASGTERQRNLVGTI